MKNLYILIFVSVLTTSLHAQDLIITVTRDTIRCKIIEMDSISVKYEAVKENGKKTFGVLWRGFVSDFRIEQKKVVSHAEIEDRPEITSFVEIEDTVSKPEFKTPTIIERSKREYTTFRWAFAPGYAKRLSKIPELKSGNDTYVGLFKNLTNGFSWESEMQFYLNKKNALALKVSGVHSSVSKDRASVNIPDFGEFYNYKLKQNIIYVGPAWAKLFDTKHFLFSSSLSLGALFFVETQYPYGSSAMEGNKKRSVAGGINYGIGSEVKVSHGCAIGLKLGVTLDTVSMLDFGSHNFKSQIPVSWSSFNLAAYISFRN
jgi:hypothetical protein